jgi:molybdopterin/thiamine biosynthesis adenylyltransferase
MKFIINDKIKVLFLKNNCILVDNGVSQEKHSLNAPDFNELMGLIQNKKIFETSELSLNVMRLLEKLNMLIKLSKCDVALFDTQHEKTMLFFKTLKISSNVLHNLKNKTVMFVGCGGITGVMLEHLLSVGIKKYILIDGDVVNQSNLNRQHIFNDEDIGKQKVVILKDYINKKIQKSHVYILPSFIYNKEDIISNVSIVPDFIVCAADMPLTAIKRIVAETAINFNCPCIFGGVSVFEGGVGPLLVTKDDKLAFVKEQSFIEDNVNYFSACNSSFGPTNSIIASYMAIETVMYLTDARYCKSLNKEMLIRFF